MDLDPMLILEGEHGDDQPVVLPWEPGFALRGQAVQLRLSEDKLEYSPLKDAWDVRSLPLADMIGSRVHVREGKQSSAIRADGKGRDRYTLEVYNYVPSRGGVCCASNAGQGGDGPIARMARHVLFEVESAVLAHKWDRAIKDRLNPLPTNNKSKSTTARQQRQQEDDDVAEGTGTTPGGDGDGDDHHHHHRRRRLLVFVNPVSGTGRARKVYDGMVKVMMEQADVAHDVIVTDHRNHAREYVKGQDLGGLDGIVVIGGDGLLYEVINGLFDKDPDGLSALKKMPVGVVRGGTGNGLFATVLHHNNHAFDEVSATFVILKGKAVPADISFVQQATGSRHLSFLSLTWGLISDVDLDSESLRFLGMMRTTIYSLICIARLRGYQGRFSYLPADRSPQQPPPPPPSSSPLSPLQPQLPRPPTTTTTTSSSSGEVMRNVTQAPLPPLDQPLPEGWVTIEGDFLMVLCSHVSHIAEDVHNSPGKALGDGLFHVLIIRKPVSRSEVLHLFLQIETGQHVHGDCVEVYWAKAYRLEPLTPQGQYSLDGERIEYGPIQAAVVPQTVQLMSDATHLLLG